MDVADIAQRVIPFAQSALQDDDVTDRLRDSGRAGREALARARSRRAPQRSVVQRVGVAVGELGAAVVALSKVSPEPRRRRGRFLVAPLLAAAGVGSVLAVRARQQAPDETTAAEPTGPAPGAPMAPAPSPSASGDDSPPAA